MTLSNGRRYLAIPGPSAIPDRVLQAMHQAAPNIYEGDLVAMTESLIPDLQAVARTKGKVAIYVGNGHGAWEAALANVVGAGDTVLALASGTFGLGWGNVAERLGARVQTIDFGPSAVIDPAALEAALRDDKGSKIKAVTAVFVDTSSSLKADIAALREVLDRVGHPALLLVDCIASLACDPFEMDAWGADIVVTASQKGLMTPPGVAFVFLNERAERAQTPKVSAYWDWAPRIDPEFYYERFYGTAPTHHLFGLREALDMIAEEGIEAIWARHHALARAIWAAAEVWAEEGPLRLNVADPKNRSWAVTSLAIGAPHGAKLREWTDTRAGVVLGIGLGREPSDGFFRIGHMGHVNAHMVLGVLGVIEAGLSAIGVPHGRGALEAAARVIAEAA